MSFSVRIQTQREAFVRNTLDVPYLGCIVLNAAVARKLANARNISDGHLRPLFAV